MGSLESVIACFVSQIAQLKEAALLRLDGKTMTTLKQEFARTARLHIFSYCIFLY